MTLVYSVAMIQYINPDDMQKFAENVIDLMDKGGKFVFLWPNPRSRDHQHDLKSEDLKNLFEQVSQNNTKESHINLIIGEPIADPDKRKGFEKEDKEKSVEFMVLSGHCPKLLQEKIGGKGARELF